MTSLPPGAPRQRREKGSGSKPRWDPRRSQYTANVTLADGKRRTIRGKTEREVEKARAVLLGTIEAGEPIISERYTVAQYLNEWLQHVKVSGIKTGSYESYESLVRIHLIPTLGKCSLKLLSPKDVQTKLIAAKLAEGSSPRRVAMMRECLRAALSHAMRMDMVTRNVAKLVRIKVPDNSRYGKALSFTQATELLRASTGKRNEPLFLLLLTTTLRLGEALALRWSDVDTRTNQLNVEKIFERHDNTRFTPLKAGLGKRIPLIPEALHALRVQKARQALERQIAGEVWREDLDFVFTNEIGEPVAQRGVQDAFKRALADAELDPTYRVHDLRHTSISFLIALHVPIPTIMAIAGHSTLAMVARYAHIDDAMLEDARTKLAGLWAGSGVLSS